MLLAGRLSILSRAQRSPESRKIEKVRPIQNLPAGTNTMLSGAAVCAAMGSAAQMEQRIVNRIFRFMLYANTSSIGVCGINAGPPRGAVCWYSYARPDGVSTIFFDQSMPRAL